MMSSETSTESFTPWQFFTLAGLAAATGVVFLAVFAWHLDRAAAVLLSVTVGAGAFAGYAAWRTVAPLTGEEADATPPATAGRTRAGLEREKLLTLRAIKDLEFDRAMGKMSEGDFAEMAGRLRVRAARLIRQLDASVSYRDTIEREVAARQTGRACPSCGGYAEAEARFCQRCGTALEAK